jgi:hypothetical protein
MSRVGIVVVAIAMAAGAAHAADFDVPLTLPPNARINLAIARSGSALPGMTLTFRYREQVSVVPGGYRLHQTLSGMDLPRILDSASRTMIENMTRLTGDIVLKTDQTMKPVRVENWQDQRDAMTGLVRKAQVSQQIRDALESGRQSIARLTPEQAASLFRELGMAAAVQGAALSLNRPILTASRVANPLGGEPIKANIAILLEKVDPDRHMAAIHLHQELDPDDADRAARAILQAVVARKSGTGQAALAKLKVENTLDCRYQMDMQTGLASRSECTSITTAVDATLTPRAQTDRWVITQALAP